MVSRAEDRSVMGLEAPLSLAVVGGRAAARVLEIVDSELARWAPVDAALTEPLIALRELVVAGGKRLRPAFCHWAFVGAGGDPDDPLVIDASAAIELLHTFALVHDDVMDGSDRRRGRPSVHRAFADAHDGSRRRGEARRFGEGAAILVGDFAFVYADRLLGSAPYEVRAIFDELRVELCVGQYLDLSATARGARGADEARRIGWYKSGKYTVERPLHLGAALAGRLTDLAEPLSAVGLPLGQAFQLRDDVLGVFGDTDVTGKPVGDDLREGKLTPLVALAAARLEPGPPAQLFERIGSQDLSGAEVVSLRALLTETGAREDVELAIGQLVGEALDAIAIAPITEPARVALEELATYVAWRDR
jgi:geranylgeranyl diphosphate synthase, type I